MPLMTMETIISTRVSPAAVGCRRRAEAEAANRRGQAGVASRRSVTVTAICRAAGRRLAVGGADAGSRRRRPGRPGHGWCRKMPVTPTWA